MSNRETASEDLRRLPDQDEEKLSTCLLPMLAAESSLAKDWLTPEEESAWANL